MKALSRPVLFDTDVIICLHQWDVWRKTCRLMGPNACVAELVARREARGYRERGTGRYRPIRLAHLTADSVPRLICPGALTADQYGQYLRHFASLESADPGERETFALAWVLGYDVCSRDVSAAEIFRRHRPEGCPSRHMDVMPLLERLGILRR